MSDKKSIREHTLESIRQIVEWGTRAVTHPFDELTRWQMAARFTYDLGLEGARRLRQDRASQMAAALAFRTLFGLLPLLVVGTVIVKAIGGLEQFRQSLGDLFSSFGLDTMHVATSAAGDSQSETLDTWLLDFADQAGALDLTALTWVGLGILAYSAISLMVTIESSFNAICRAPSGRAWTWRLLVYWAVVTLGPTALIATVWVDNRFDLMLTDVVAWQWLGQLTSMLWSFIITSLAMFAIYRMVPNARVAMRPALIGGLIAGLLLEVGKRLLGAYVSDALTFRTLYGSLGLIPLFMFWVYLMWLVVLFGLEVASTLQALSGRRHIPQRQEASGIVDPTSVLAVMRVVAERFGLSTPTTVRDIVTAAGIATPVAERMLDELVRAGLLHRINGADGEASGFSLTRPADAIDAAAVIEVGHTLSQLGQPGMAGRLGERLRQAQLDLAAGETLASMIPVPEAGSNTA